MWPETILSQNCAESIIRIISGNYRKRRSALYVPNGLDWMVVVFYKTGTGRQENLVQGSQYLFVNEVRKIIQNKHEKYLLHSHGMCLNFEH